MCGVEIDYYTNTGIMDWGGMGWNWGLVEYGGMVMSGESGLFLCRRKDGWKERKKESCYVYQG